MDDYRSKLDAITEPYDPLNEPGRFWRAAADGLNLTGLAVLVGAVLLGFIALPLLAVRLFL
jgi:hypothetical protein